jgi:hypothetical protein
LFTSDLFRLSAKTEVAPGKDDSRKIEVAKTEVNENAKIIALLSIVNTFFEKQKI